MPQSRDGIINEGMTKGINRAFIEQSFISEKKKQEKGIRNKNMGTKYVKSLSYVDSGV